METILEFLSGKKTYFFGFLTFCVGGAWALGAIDAETAAKAGTLLGSASLMALRAGMAKTEAKAEEAAKQVAALRRDRDSYLA